jgi:NADPH:quinone reductase-like Zn-dependent oxidoreductase
MIPRLLWRKLVATMSSSPTYDLFLTNANADDLDVLRKMAEEKKLKAVLDPAEPFEFNDSGVKALFAKIMSGRTKGKLVMEVSK